MPLSQSDLDYDGSWGDVSKSWPKIRFLSGYQADLAYVIAWKNVRIPYGSCCLIGKQLRLKTDEFKNKVEKELNLRGIVYRGD